MARISWEAQKAMATVYLVHNDGTIYKAGWKSRNQTISDLIRRDPELSAVLVQSRPSACTEARRR